jgi:hypothetical protein
MITRIYEKEYVTLDYDSSVPCVISTSLKFMMLEEFKSQLNFGLEFMKEKIKETGRMMWLPDTTLAGAVDDESIKYAIEDWTPRAIAAEIKHVGFVISESEWANVATEVYGESVKGSGEKEGMTTSFFRDVETAKNWFRNMSSSTSFA